MNKAQMMLGGPGLEGYAFNADVYCVPCGHAIILGLPNIEYSYTDCRDSETVPAPIFFGESDHAQHCADCGKYLYGETTTGD